MKYLILLLISFNLYSFESEDEINNLKFEDYMFSLLDKECQGSYSEPEGSYDNLIISDRRQHYDCPPAVKSFKECTKVTVCQKPTLQELSDRFDAFKAKTLGKFQRKKQREAIEDKLKDPAQRGSVDFEAFKRVQYEDR